jgi:hypothetical protein
MGKPAGADKPQRVSLIDLHVQPYLKEQRNAVVLDEHSSGSDGLRDWTGVRLWLVLKHPDTGPESRVPDAPHQAQVAESAEPQAGDVYGPRHASGSRALEGAHR